MAIQIDSFPGREVYVNGNPYLYFGGTSYLGLQDLPEFQELFIKHIRNYGTNYGASRKSNVQFSVFDKAERHLAQLAGSEACITLSSGYLAGQFLSGFMQAQKYKLFYVPHTHSALFRKASKSYVTYASLNFALESHLKSTNKATPVLFLDSIDFSGGNFPDFQGLKNLPLSKLILVVDDSHGIGILGSNGGGVYQTLNRLGAKKLFVCCSLGKGFGLQAGAIFGKKEDLEVLKKSPLYGGSSPASPAAMATLLEADTIYENRRNKLQENLAFFLQHLVRNKKLRYMEGHPTISFQSPALVDYLFENKIIVTDFKYPNEDSETMSRIVISANHTRDDLKILIQLLNSFDYE